MFPEVIKNLDSDLFHLEIVHKGFGALTSENQRLAIIGCGVAVVTGIVVIGYLGNELIEKGYSISIGDIVKLTPSDILVQKSTT